MAKRRSKTAEQQAKFYEVGDTAESFFEYLVLLLDNGNFSQYRELFSEMSFSDRERYVSWLLMTRPSNAREYMHYLF